MGSPRQPAGLRERKKIRTRDAIRHAAAQLINSKGYANTTVEQIADAAEVSPATFFRYFPTKGSALISNVIDQVAVSALASQPADVSTAQAFRQALEITQTTLANDEWDFERRLWQLALSIPELRELQYAQHRRTAASMAEVECQRLGRDPDDFEVHVFFGAIFDAGLAVLGDSPGIPDRILRVIDFVDHGMPLR